MRLLLYILLPAIIAISASAQTTTRRNLRPIKHPAPESRVDSFIPTDTTAFRIFGYEKTLRSNTESFFAKNLTSDTIRAICGEIEYRTMGNIQLHRRSFTQRVNIPPAATRQINLRSWDRQNVWYYHLSSPTRTSAQATPYTVRISITGIVRQ